MIGQPYMAALTATGGTGHYTWALAEGSSPLPAGLSLNTDGTITGTPTGPAGTASVTVAVKDAGTSDLVQSATATFTLRTGYDFAGFQPPVTPGLNVIKAGQAVPIKFSLHGYQGMGVLDSPALTTVNHTCDNITSTLLPDTASAVDTGNLTYDPGTDTYAYVWKTPKTATGCITLQIHLNGTPTQAAEFKFK